MRLFSLYILLMASILFSQTIQISSNLEVDGIPPIPVSIIEEVRAYTEGRGASFVDWHPVSGKMVIRTRFGNSNQIHLVDKPEGMRRQLTFFSEPVNFATFDPARGNYFLFLRDNGGNEFSQIYRYDMKSGKSVILTDGSRSQNGGLKWNRKGNMISYWSTKRNGKDRDIYVMDPLEPQSARMVAENSGGGWAIVDWFPDDSKLILQEYKSANDMSLHILTLSDGKISRLLPKTDELAVFRGVAVAPNGKDLYLLTNKNGEFTRLAKYDMVADKLQEITSGISWDIDDVAITENGSRIVFTANENGFSRFYLLTTSDNKFHAIEGLPKGVAGEIKWNGNDIFGFSISTYNSSSDAYEYNVKTKRLKRWTYSETGGADLSLLKEPELISWSSFDGTLITGFLYRAPDRFIGKRPVIIDIHGGPEMQARPGFKGGANYYINELGISVIYPNVRGSRGYGKTYIDKDNGKKRMDAVRDIGALLEWISKQPALDYKRIMITGRSYGGFMSLAVSYMYSDMIRCAVDVVGISNFNTFLKNTEEYRRDLRRAEYGDERVPDMAAFFDSIAPLNNVDKIKKPLFIVQGGNDPRVPPSEAIQMKEKIKANNKDVWFLLARDEGHSFGKKSNIDFEFYSTVNFVNSFLMK